jgi:subtilisin family serine protease
MRKIILISTLLLVLLSFALLPLATPTIETTIDIPYDIMTFREQFAFEYNSESPMTSSLTELVPWWIDMVDAEFSTGGEGVYVAVLDTGLLEMWPFFFSQANIADDLGIGFTHDIYWDYGINDLVIGPLEVRDFITDVPEGSGHGTHVTSTIVGFNYNNLYWIKGVAPEATIIPVLVLDSWIVSSPYGDLWFRGGTDAMIATGIDYVTWLAENVLDGPVIISMSLGGDEPSPGIGASINNAIDAGVLVVASAGNEGYAGMGWPGAYPEVISCAMAGWTEQFYQSWVGDVPEKLNTVDYLGNNWQVYLDDFSSRPNMDLGQLSFHLDVTAPGAAIVGPYKPYLRDETWIGYYYLWGTSMAAPHVSGIAALLLDEHPTMSQSLMEFTLKVAANIPLACDGAWAWDPFVEDYYYFGWYGIDWGSGFLQADSALEKANLFASKGGRGSRSTLLP